MKLTENNITIIKESPIKFTPSTPLSSKKNHSHTKSGHTLMESLHDEKE